jgi:hypothetical protein
MRLNGMPKQLLGGRLKEQYESARFMQKLRRKLRGQVKMKKAAKRSFFDWLLRRNADGAPKKATA